MAPMRSTGSSPSRRNRRRLLADTRRVDSRFLHHRASPGIMKTLLRPLAAGASALLVLSSAASAQQRIPIIDLGPGMATSVETIGSVIGIRQLPNGSVLVDDGDRRQLRLFEPT